MSKVSSDAARFNRMKKRKNLLRTRMRVLRAEMAERKLTPSPDLAKAKT
jgi:hypothetical protein